MKNISTWANHHVSIARMLIIVSRLLLLLSTFYIGITLNELGIALPANVIYLCGFAALVILVAVYPSREIISLSKKLLYARRKTCDFLLPLCSSIVIIAMINNGDAITSSSFVYGTVKVKGPTAQEILSSGKTREMLTRKEKRILKREFFKQLKIYAAAKITGDGKTSGKAWKIALAIIGMVGLLYLLAALACSLSCNGSDAAAIIVAIFGISAIVICFVLLMKRIHRGPPQKTSPKVE